MMGRPRHWSRREGSWRRAAVALAVAVALAGPLPAVAEAPLRLSPPVACELGATCFIQHYADVDPTPAARDYACGSATYDGHDGTDFRLFSAAATAGSGVDVVAAADGLVLRLRDGIADAFAREVGKAATRDRACGNGLVIAHAEGLETQYCHLLAGSVAVKAGQQVRRGEPLGKVGYSGLADFAHLHFAVRRQGRLVDPFTGQDLAADPSAPKAPAACEANADAGTRLPAAGLWDEVHGQPLAYKPTLIMQADFSTAIPDWKSLEQDHRSYARADRSGPALVAFARIVNLGAGDRVRIRLTGPGDYGLEHLGEAPGRAKPIFVAGAGRRRKGDVWPAGRYEAAIDVLRNGQAIASTRTTLVID